MDCTQSIFQAGREGGRILAPTTDGPLIPHRTSRCEVCIVPTSLRSIQRHSQAIFAFVQCILDLFLFGDVDPCPTYPENLSVFIQQRGFAGEVGHVFPMDDPDLFNHFLFLRGHKTPVSFLQMRGGIGLEYKGVILAD